MTRREMLAASLAALLWAANRVVREMEFADQFEYLVASARNGW